MREQTTVKTKQPGLAPRYSCRNGQRTHLHRCVDAAHSDEREVRVPFDHVHDVSVSLENIVQLAVRLSPDEDVPVVGARRHVLRPWSEEIYYAVL